MNTKPEYLNNILFTGRPGIGKTTLIKKLAQQLSCQRISGFYTEEIRPQGKREGFSISTFNGLNRTLASINLRSPFRVSKYGVDLEALHEVIDHLRSHLLSVDLWLIDEIGKMESFSKKFRNFTDSILCRPVPVIATISLSAGGWIENIRRAHTDSIFELTEINRDLLFSQMKTMILNKFTPSTATDPRKENA